MGFGPFSSESTANDNRQTAGDAAIVVGKGAQKTNVSSPGGSILDLSGSKQLTLTVNDTKPIIDLASGFSTTVADITSKSGSTISNLLASQTDTLKDALAKIADLGANSQTGGDSGRNKIILYVVLATLTLLGVVAWLRK